MTLQVFIGFDSRQRDAYYVAKHSIETRASVPVQVQPLKLSKLSKHGILTRPVEKQNGQMWCPISEAPMSTEFAISRFCVPFLQREGWALFCDSDVVMLRDIKELFDLADDQYAVMVVKHSQGHGSPVKMDGQAQTYYSRKNWSSVVLWNCGHPSNQALTLVDLNTWPGRNLHAFQWLADDEIGELPLTWNYLVGVSPAIPATTEIKLAHFTLGTPNLPGCEDMAMSETWLREYESYRKAVTDGEAK